MSKQFIKNKKRLSRYLAALIALGSMPSINIYAEEVNDIEPLSTVLEENISSQENKITSSEVEEIEEIITSEEDGSQTISEEDLNTEDSECETTEIKEVNEKNTIESLQYNPLSGIIENEFVQASISDEGRFTIGTTGGNPTKDSDNNKTLLYGHPNPGTSYTSFILDGQVHEYSQYSNVQSNSNSHISKNLYGDIEVTQYITIDSRYKDMVNVKYSVKNIGEKSHNLGFRIMMDTSVASNDSAKFRVNGQKIETETEFVGANLPTTWQAFDNLENPTVIAQGNLKNTSNAPSKIQFANWSNLRDEAWGYEVSRNSSIGDSGVALVWNESQISPNQTIEYSTQYGLGEYTVASSNKLIATLDGKDKISLINDKYETEEFDITSILKNDKSRDMRNISVTLNLDEGLKLKDGQSKTINIEKLLSGEEKGLSWIVELDSTRYTQRERNLGYKITVKCENEEDIVVSRNVVVEGKNDGATVVSVDEINIDSLNAFDKFVETLTNLFNLKDDQGRNLYRLDGDCNKEQLSNGDELYTLIIQELEYESNQRALAVVGKVKKEYIVKIRVKKAVVKAIADRNNGNSSNNTPSNNNTSNNTNSNNKPSSNKKPSSNTVNTGDAGILGYLGVAGISAIVLNRINRRKED